MSRFVEGLSSATAYVCATPLAFSLSTTHLPSEVNTNPAARWSLSMMARADAESNGAFQT